MPVCLFASWFFVKRLFIFVFLLEEKKQNLSKYSDFILFFRFSGCYLLFALLLFFYHNQRVETVRYEMRCNEHTLDLSLITFVFFSPSSFSFAPLHQNSTDTQNFPEFKSMLPLFCCLLNCLLAFFLLFRLIITCARNWFVIQFSCLLVFTLSFSCGWFDDKIYDLPVIL